MTLTVVVADDSALLRSGIVRLLRDENIQVAGEASDANGLLSLVDDYNPDVAITDIRMPPSYQTEGLEAAIQIRASHPHIGVLLLSQYVETEHAAELLGTGASGIGYLLKDRVTDVDDFIQSLYRVAGGNSAIDPLVVQHLLGRRHRGTQPIDTLSDRERAVLALMAEGRSNRSIGSKLFLAERTVETHIGTIFSKLSLPPQPEDHRRVLAVIAYLRPETNPGPGSSNQTPRPLG